MSNSIIDKALDIASWLENGDFVERDEIVSTIHELTEKYEYIYNDSMITRHEFEKSYVPIPESGCWIWLNGLDKDGYGRFPDKGKLKGAHRYSWEVHHGLIPDNMFVLHKCDVPACVNPVHLFLGTHQDNMDDRNHKGRHKGINKGENNGHSKLTESDIRAIRKSDKSDAEVAAFFHVTVPNIRSIRTRKTWKHVK